MSSAYAKRVVRPNTSISLSSCMSLITLLRAKLKSAGDSASPCFNPHLTSKSFDVFRRKRTLQNVFELQHLIRLTNFFGIPNCISADHHRFLMMLS